MGTRPMHTILRPDMRETMVRMVTCDPLAEDTAQAISDIECADGSVACYEPRGALTYLDVDGVDRVGKMVSRLRNEGTTVVLCGCNRKGVEGKDGQQSPDTPGKFDIEVALADGNAGLP